MSKFRLSDCLVGLPGCLEITGKPVLTEREAFKFVDGKTGEEKTGHNYAVVLEIQNPLKSEANYPKIKISERRYIEFLEGEKTPVSQRQPVTIRASVYCNYFPANLDKQGSKDFYKVELKEYSATAEAPAADAPKPYGK